MFIQDPQERLEYYLRTHIVGLAIKHRATSSSTHSSIEKIGPVGIDLFSGFIMSVRGMWFWITAGHIFQNIQCLIEEHHRELFDCRLFDFHADRASGDFGLPIDHRTICNKNYVVRDELGLDFGVIHLSDLYIQGLKEVGVRPIDEGKWKIKPHQLKFPVYEMFEIVGLPTETMKNSVNHLEGDRFRVRGQTLPCAAPVRILTSPPADLENPKSRFYGTLADEQAPDDDDRLPLKDIDGLSGAPIFGLCRNKDGGLDYWLAAIQSGWYENRRIVTGCLAHVVGQIIENKIDELICEQAKQASRVV